MNSAAPRAATTTPTARTTRSPGSTGSSDPQQREFMDFVERMIAFRRSHAIFSRRHFLTGSNVAGETFKDITWFTPGGTEMTDFDWQQGFARCLSVHLSGAAVHRTDSRGQPVRDENFTLLFNAHHDTMDFVCRRWRPGARWRVELDTETRARWANRSTWPAAPPARCPPARSCCSWKSRAARRTRAGFSDSRAPAARTARRNALHAASAPRGCRFQ